MEIRDILAQNIRRLMDSHPSLNTQTKLQQATQKVDSTTGEITLPPLTQSTINRILHSQVDPTIATVQAIADAFGIPMTRLLTQQGENSNVSPTTEEVELLAKMRRLNSGEQKNVHGYVNLMSAISDNTLVIKKALTQLEQCREQ